MKNALPIAALAPALFLAGNAQAQTISWQIMDGVVGTSFYLPKIASDGDIGDVGELDGDMITVGQEYAYPTPAFLQVITATPTSWGSPYSYGSGANPAAAVNLMPPDNDTDALIEFHQGNGNALLYRTAASPHNKFNPVWSKGVQYGNGYSPTISIDPVGNNPVPVVEVHQASPGISNLWYHVGHLSVNAKGVPSLTWGSGYQFGYGNAASVTLCNGVAVEVHEGNSGTLWYSVGVISGNTVAWSASGQYDKGYRPSITGCAYTGAPWQANVIEVHQSGNPGTGQYTPLLYHVALSTNSEVDWQPAIQYDVGCSPSVAPLNYFSNVTFFFYYTLIEVTHRRVRRCVPHVLEHGNPQPVLIWGMPAGQRSHLPN